MWTVEFKTHQKNNSVTLPSIISQTSQGTNMSFRGFKKSCSWVVIGGFQSILFASAFLEGLLLGVAHCANYLSLFFLDPKPLNSFFDFFPQDWNLTNNFWTKNCQINMNVPSTQCQRYISAVMLLTDGSVKSTHKLGFELRVRMLLKSTISMNDRIFKCCPYFEHTDAYSAWRNDCICVLAPAWLMEYREDMQCCASQFLKYLCIQTEQ